MNAIECPYLELCERDFVGPALSEDEQVGLSEHLSGGCSACEQRIELQLTGSGEGDLAESIRELDGRLGRAVDFAAEAMAGSQVAILARVESRLAEDDREARRRVRRRHQRILFYVVNLAAVVLLCVAYMGTLMATRVRSLQAQRVVTQSELQALTTALVRFVRDHPGDVPQDLPELIEALSRTRRGGTAPYYPFDAERLEEQVYLDGFRRPYRFQPTPGGARITSSGPNRVDDGGSDDDLSRQVLFAHQ